MLDVDRGCLLVSELGRNPKEWKLKRLSNFYKHILGNIKPDTTERDWIRK